MVVKEPRRPKRPRDPNQLAKQVVGVATEEPDLFKLAQEEDKYNPLRPLLEHMRKHPEFDIGACLLRGYITALQYNERALEEEVKRLKARLKRYEKED